MNLNMLKRKWKVDENFDSEYGYVYGIVTTGKICFGMIFPSFEALASARDKKNINIFFSLLTDIPKSLIEDFLCKQQPIGISSRIASRPSTIQSRLNIESH